MKEINNSDLEKILSKVEHPEIANTLSELGMIGNTDINVDEKIIMVTLVLPMLTIPIEIRDMLIKLIVNAHKQEVSGYKLKIALAEMNEKQKMNFFSLSKENRKL